MLLAMAMAATLAAADQQINVWAYGCDFSKTQSVEILAQNRSLFGQNGKRITVEAQAAENGRLTFSFRLPPGSFDIFYTTVGQECDSGGGGLTVLPGQDRHILVSMLPGMWITDWHAQRFFAGTLPAVGIGVSVVVSKSSDCPIDEDVNGSPAREYAATIDGNAYYVGYVSGLHAFLRLRSAGLDDVLYIALPDEPSPRYNEQYVVRNVTADDLQRLTTHVNPSRPECILVPSGISKRFAQ